MGIDRLERVFPKELLVDIQGCFGNLYPRQLQQALLAKIFLAFQGEKRPMTRSILSQSQQPSKVPVIVCELPPGMGKTSMFAALVHLLMKRLKSELTMFLAVPTEYLKKQLQVLLNGAGIAVSHEGDSTGVFVMLHSELL